MKKKSSSIWTSSPCTLAFAEHRVALQKCERFSFHSIYYREKMGQKNKIKLQIIHPENSLIDFRRQIQECGNYRRKLSKQCKSVEIFTKKEQIQLKQSKLSTLMNQKVIQRLTLDEPIELDKIYDRNGMRSTFYTSKGEEVLRYSFKKSKTLQKFFQRRKIKGPKVYVSGSARMDLSKPQNFNPGPGSYFLDKRDNQQISMIYQRAHISASKKHKSPYEILSQFKKQNMNNQDEKQNANYFSDMVAKERKKDKKSRLGRISTAIKSKTQYSAFSVA